MSNGQETSAARIVVGVDGSLESKEALRWAVREAELTGAWIEAVIAWRYPAMMGGYGWAPVPSDVELDFEGISAKILNDSIAEVIEPDSQVKISTSVRQGNPAQQLLDAADGADLLVVGSRGHGGFAGALLGSVSQHCAHHAPCPLVIVRATAASRR